MKTTITAKHSLTIVQNGVTANIVKGDIFELYGKVFAYKSILIDATDYNSAFEVSVSNAVPTPLIYKLTYDITLMSGTKKVTIAKDTILQTSNDIVAVSGAILDVNEYRNQVTVLAALPTTTTTTTEAPTTQAPTTQAPTTEAPTTQAPTTEAPTTQAPTTQAPTTQAPTTQAPGTTQAP